MTNHTDDFTVTPYEVEGSIDYDRLLDRFGADELTHDQLKQFPQPPHPLLRRGIFYAGRDVDRVLDAMESDGPLSIVTGRGPSGPMHLGHVLPFYFAKWLQAETGAHVYIPISDDEKHYAKDLTLSEVRTHARENLRDVLAVGFDPERTRIVIDTEDADVLYPTAARIASRLTPATVEAVYGEPPNVGLGFYPAMQATHLLLPQLVRGPHPTLVPIAVDQDPHVRLCRDVAAKEAFDAEKPAALLSRFLPSLEGGSGKMSTSGTDATIRLTDDRETVRETVLTHAYSGGKTSVAEHREEGGDPDVDVAYQLLYAFFEPDDREIERLAREYRSGDLLSGELKTIAADRIADFLTDHQRRREALDPLDAELERYRLREDERERLQSLP